MKCSDRIWLARQAPNIKCQPSTFQFFNEKGGYIYYGVYNLETGNASLNQIDSDPDLSILGFLPKNSSSNEVIAFGITQTTLQIDGLDTDQNSISPIFTIKPSYKYDYAAQQFVLNRFNTILVPGSTLLNGKNYLSLLQFKFGSNTRLPPIPLGQGIIPTGGSPIYPLGAYDPILQDYYIYYTVGGQTAIIKYNFIINSYAILPLDFVPTKLNGIDQLFFFKGDLFYCRIDKGVGVTIALMSLGGEVNYLYKDTNADKKFSVTIQPFVFDQPSGTVSILNPVGDTLYLDVFDLTSYEVTSFTKPNNIPTGTFVISTLYQ
ncbi:hypothetical protein DFA_04966 [Cavenderia fasciculata]|uniref:Uncharacterized protein n=1 Tax=Cavenderia fasciculata TaxID=261658 RepID=F4PMN9_CACFS|nr:uncharacterized protein DFA_04966 [Cavenderia fasciculata]EGG22836.1 hypothetical protein DFA_04966 [Cavenderia fasciculata]|eukprot:XP_004360687.1 hypothetical protein DFA_04966 [Cavenderia fasciculata]